MDPLATLLLVLGAIGVMALLAQRVSIPAPVLLAMAGVAWSLVPAFPRLDLPPWVILSILLPPLLYADAWNASWHDFRRWIRPILVLAVGLVAFTILAAGVALHLALPHLPWAACFLLGAIVSPTDTVAVHAVLERLRVPRRVTAILGGESLINDATGLLGVNLATVVILTGVFEADAIAIGFARITLASLAIGAAVGLLAALVNYTVRGTTVLFAFSLAAPYAAYLLAEKAHASGILAVVIAGLVASWRVHYIAPESRPDLLSSWDQLVFLLNGVMFLYVGLQAAPLLEQAVASAPRILPIALLCSATVILARIVWIFPGAYLPLRLLPRFREREGGYPSLKGVTLGAWCGVRGAVSLAAALSLPATLPGGSPFPGRLEIIACTLMVILVTLIGQGATLHPLVRLLGFSDADPTDAEIHGARKAVLSAGIQRLDAFCAEEKCPVAIFRLRDAMQDQLAALEAEDETAREQARRRLEVARNVRRAIYEAQTRALLELRDAGALNDRAYQELQLELDRAHAGLRHAPA
jgi:CPA1 family monovalent cation:H+ antiporter